MIIAFPIKIKRVMPLVHCNLKNFLRLHENAETEKDEEILRLFQLYETKRDKEETSVDKEDKISLLDERIRFISSMENNNTLINDGLLCIFMDTYKVRILEAVSKKLDFSNLQGFISTYHVLKTVEKEKGKVSGKIQRAILEAQEKIISTAAKKDFAAQALRWIIINDTSKELVLYAYQQAIDNSMKLNLPWCFNSMLLENAEK